LTVKNFSTLQIALGVSALLHAVVLTTRFVDPQSFNRVFKDTPLEVILVNARSNEKPEFAKAIAQASLAGGGQLEKGRATSPLPPSALTDLGDAAEDDARAANPAAGANQKSVGHNATARPQAAHQRPGASPA